jgi:hypothetical protein
MAVCKLLFPHASGENPALCFTLGFPITTFGNDKKAHRLFFGEGTSPLR